MRQPPNKYQKVLLTLGDSSLCFSREALYVSFLSYVGWSWLCVKEEVDWWRSLDELCCYNCTWSVTVHTMHRLCNADNVSENICNANSLSDNKFSEALFQPSPFCHPPPPTLISEGNVNVGNTFWSLQNDKSQLLTLVLLRDYSALLLRS